MVDCAKITHISADEVNDADNKNLPRYLGAKLIDFEPPKHDTFHFGILVFWQLEHFCN